MEGPSPHRGRHLTSKKMLEPKCLKLTRCWRRDRRMQTYQTRGGGVCVEPPLGGTTPWRRFNAWGGEAMGAGSLHVGSDLERRIWRNHVLGFRPSVCQFAVPWAVWNGAKKGVVFAQHNLFATRGELLQSLADTI